LIGELLESLKKVRIFVWYYFPLEFIMDDRITIIEGPTPTFEEINDGWALGLNEGPVLYDLVMTRVRTFNGQALVERCHRAWKDRSNIFLHYRNELGLEEKAPIMAARSVATQDGSVLLLWVRLEFEETEPETGKDSGSEDLDE
jgi:hypothetical protein